jgi:nitroimidazol reductase NimA-like FMN-containing flavoprotein (pyridoxamine 5'-phosphate oxidase superfamily)
MYETAADLERLQAVLDRSFEAGGNHLKSIITPERRMSASETAELLQGMRLLALATVTRDGRPLVGPVDGLFYRGEFWFGSSPDSVRFRHIRERPRVSATHTPSEEYSVTVHGRAEIVDLESPDLAGFRDYCVEIYGEQWNDWGDGAAYARIEAELMFTFRMRGEAPAEEPSSP